MANSATTTYSAQQLVPVFDQEDARQIAVNFPASTGLIARGTILGEVTASRGTYKPYSSSVVAAGAAPTPTAAAGSTAFAAGVFQVGYTYTNSLGETTISALATVTLTAGQQINVAALTPLPTGATGVNYYISPGPGDSALVKATAGASNGSATSITAVAAGDIQPPTTNTAYVNTDGSATARAIAAIDMYIDSSGNVTFTTTSGQVGDEFGVTHKTAPVFVSGTFYTQELTGLDAKAVSDLSSHLLEGTTSNGIIRIG